jgi:hypothetical protein
MDKNDVNEDVKPHEVRMLQEYLQLSTRLRKIKEFIENTENFESKLTQYEQSEMINQHQSMVEYMIHLNLRIVYSGLFEKLCTCDPDGERFTLDVNI